MSRALLRYLHLIFGSLIAGSTPLTLFAQDVRQASEQVAAEAPREASPAGGTIVMQDEDSVLVSDLVGASVSTLDQERIGDVDDVLVSFGGAVEGVVIGVGGFLGVGEKKVAMDISRFSLEVDDQQVPHLYLEVTPEELDSAPEFRSVRQQKADLQLNELREEGLTDKTADDASAGE